MKYIIRLIAALPILSVGFAIVILAVLSLDYPWLIIPCIGHLLAIIFLLDNYELIVLAFMRALAAVSKEESV